MAHCGHICCVRGQRAHVEPHAQHGAPRGEAALLLTRLQPAACSLLLGKPSIPILLQTPSQPGAFHSRGPLKSRFPGAESADAIEAHPGTDSRPFTPSGFLLGESRLWDC